MYVILACLTAGLRVLRRRVDVLSTVAANMLTVGVGLALIGEVLGPSFSVAPGPPWMTRVGTVAIAAMGSVLLLGAELGLGLVALAAVRSTQPPYISPAWGRRLWHRSRRHRRLPTRHP